jgi:phytanoyl-CoA hydroxylase
MDSNFNKGFYLEHGFTIQHGLLSSKIISELNMRIDKITKNSTLERHNKLALEMEPNQELSEGLVRRIYTPCKYYPEFRDLSKSDLILDKVESLIGSDLMLHYSKINMKPNNIGSLIKWHQDYPFYPLTNTNALALLIYLDDTTKENGCLNVIPQKITNAEVFDHTDKDGYFIGSVDDGMIKHESIVPIEGKAGTGIFMNCLTLHSSNINYSLRGRRVLIIGYRASTAIPLYYGDMTKVMEHECHMVRGNNNHIAEVNINNVKIPHYKNKISSIYDIQA